MNPSKHRIYIVDDDDEFRKSIVRLLISAGYLAESFPSAQSFLDSVPVDYKKGVLILDLRMPGMNGFELQKKLKKLRSELSIIMITADGQPGDRDHAMNEGATGFLQKPFQDESLLQLVREAMPVNTEK